MMSPFTGPLHLFRSFVSGIKPTVSLGVTSVVAYTYGCDDGRISQTRCALIDDGLDGRYSRCRVCRTPPAAASSARIGLAAASRPVSTADPGGFHSSGTTLPSGIRPYGDASLPRYAPGTRPSPPRSCPVGSWLQCLCPL